MPTKYKPRTGWTTAIFAAPTITWQEAVTCHIAMKEMVDQWSDDFGPPHYDHPVYGPMSHMQDVIDFVREHHMTHPKNEEAPDDA